MLRGGAPVLTGVELFYDVSLPSSPPTVVPRSVAANLLIAMLLPPPPNPHHCCCFLVIILVYARSFSTWNNPRVLFVSLDTAANGGG